MSAEQNRMLRLQCNSSIDFHVLKLRASVHLQNEVLNDTIPMIGLSSSLLLSLVKGLPFPNRHSRLKSVGNARRRG